MHARSHCQSDELAYNTVADILLILHHLVFIDVTPYPEAYVSDKHS